MKPSPNAENARPHSSQNTSQNARQNPRQSPWWLIPALTSAAMLLAWFLAPRLPDLGAALRPYAKYNLCGLLLINALHIRYRSLGRVLTRRPLLLGYGILVGNLLLPLAAFALSYFFWPRLLPAAVLLGGISSGFSAASFAILLRLAPEINLLLTLGASFLLPFSLPLLLYALAGSSIAINPGPMIWQTAWMVFAPILLERLLFFSTQRIHAWLKYHSQLILALNLSLASFIIMLSSRESLHQQAAKLPQLILFVLTLIALIYLVTLLCFWRSTLEMQLMMLTANLVTNTGMASVLALDYLDPTTLAISIIYGILWNFNILWLRTWPRIRRAMRSLGPD